MKKLNANELMKIEGGAVSVQGGSLSGQLATFNSTRLAYVNGAVAGSQLAASGRRVAGGESTSTTLIGLGLSAASTSVVAYSR